MIDTPLEGPTRRHVAELVATCFPAGTDRADAHLWPDAYESRTPYEVIEDVPPGGLDAVLAARDDIARHRLVARVVPDGVEVG